MRKLVQVSGGWDSAAALCVTVASAGDLVEGVFFATTIGCDHADAARYVAGLFDVKLHEMKVDLQLGIDPPEYVPMRNGVYAMMSANLALVRGMDAVVVGSKTVDCDPGDAYSFRDSSAEFFETMRRAVVVGSGKETLYFEKPLVGWTKAHVLAELHRNSIDVARLITCYRQTSAGPCGECVHCEIAEKARLEIGPERPR